MEKKYIGMRYVPKFAEPVEHNANNKYEPLTVVLANGQYYISRQFVPMDIEVTNRDYWLPTGDAGTDVAKAVEDLTLKVNSNTDAIIQNATALHEVENEAQQNKQDIQAGMQLIQTNSDDIATNSDNIATNTSDIATNTSDIADANDMILKLIEHENITEYFEIDPKIFGSDCRGNIGIFHNKDCSKGILSSNVYSASGSVQKKLYSIPTINFSRGFYFYLDGSFVTYLEAGKDGILDIQVNSEYGPRFYVPFDFGLPQTQTLPMTDADYQELEEFGPAPMPEIMHAPTIESEVK